LPRECELTQINGVFRSKNLFKNKHFYVGVEWKDGKHSSIPIDMATLLAPGRTYTEKNVKAEAAYPKITVNIRGFIGADRSTSHVRYLFQTDHGDISIAGFELARSCFFLNGHLARAAYRPNGLQELAHVDRLAKPVQIRFPDSTMYPVSNLASVKARRHLAWLLLDQEAKRSFFSIYQNFQKHSDEIAFELEPPNLAGWRLEVAVLNLEEDRVMQVQRIEGVEKANMLESFSEIEIHHPKKKFKAKSSSDKKAGKGGKIVDPDVDPTLDLGEMPSFGGRLHTERLKGFSFNVPDIGSTTIIGEDESKSVAVIPDSEQPKKPDIAGIGLPSKDGAAQEFNPVSNLEDDGVDEVTEDLPHKFLMFEKAIYDLEKLHWITLDSIKCGVFPEPTNRSNVVYQVRYDGRLKYFVATLTIGQSKLVLLEPDTTSLIKEKGSSTLILGLKADATKHFQEILQQFSDSGAQWNRNFARDRCDFFVACTHPNVRENGLMVPEYVYVRRWADRLADKLMEAIDPKHDFNSLS
jgi:hypothetical protein